MLTLAAAFQEILDAPARKRFLIAAQGSVGNCSWLPAYIDRNGEFRCEEGEEAGIELDEDTMDAIRLFDSGSLSSCALVARLGELGVGALVMGPESPSDAMRMIEQLKANALGRFVENYLADLKRRRPAKVYQFRPR
jgi:hypothetical protein